MSDSDSRGQGNVAGAMRRRVGRRSGGSGAGPGSGASPFQSKKKRNRAKVGKRSDPEYMMAGGYVRRAVHERVMEALSNREVRREVFEELDAYGVRHDGKRVYYGDLAELLCLRWLEDFEIEVE